MDWPSSDTSIVHSPICERCVINVPATGITSLIAGAPSFPSATPNECETVWYTTPFGCTNAICWVCVPPGTFFQSTPTPRSRNVPRLKLVAGLQPCSPLSQTVTVIAMGCTAPDGGIWSMPWAHPASRVAPPRASKSRRLESNLPLRVLISRLLKWERERIHSTVRRGRNYVGQARVDTDVSDGDASAGIQQSLLAVDAGCQIKLVNFSVAASNVHFRQRRKRKRRGRRCNRGSAPQQRECATPARQADVWCRHARELIRPYFRAG